MSFQLFSDEQIADLRTGGSILRGCLDMLTSRAVAGVTTQQLDELAAEYIGDHGATAAFFGFHGFPAHICASVNDECVHGIPGSRVLREGDIVSLDCGVLYGGLNTDACNTVAIGRVSPNAERLMECTLEALDVAVQMLAPGVRVGDISAAIGQVARRGGCKPVQSLTGHGLGTTLHQYPDIPNSGHAGTGPIFPVGTLVAIEPIFSLGSDQVVQSDDGWTLLSSDGSLTAHSEHTLLLTQDGCEIIA